MSREYSKKDFQMLLASYQEAKEIYPKRVEKDAYYSLMQMGKIRVEGIKKFENSLFKICLLVVAIMIVISCFTTGLGSLIGLFGFVFFAAGYYISTEPKGLIALYAHGLVGYCIINGFQVYSIFTNPLMTDKPFIVLSILGIAALLQFIGLIYAALYSFSDTLKTNLINKNIPIILATISTIIIHTTAILLMIK